MKYSLIALHVITSNLKKKFIKLYDLKTEQYKEAIAKYTTRLVSNFRNYK